LQAMWTVVSCIVCRAVASPTQPAGGEKNFRWGQIFVIVCKVELKNRRKSAEEAKA